MKKLYLNHNMNFLKGILKIFILLFVALTFTACSKKVTFPVSNVVPAAEAVVKVDKDDNKNYKIELQVDNLAGPERLNPGRKYYMVWMVTKEHGTLNIGRLDINRKNSGELKTNTPYEPVRIFITAEDDQQPVLPSSQEILNSGEFKV